MTYKQAYDDHSYLWETYGPAYDMTGGYVDQEDLATLLKSPTARTAQSCLERQIGYWFQAGPESMERESINWQDPKIIEIAERYGVRTP